MPPSVEPEIIDIHTHFRPAWWTASGLGGPQQPGGPGPDLPLATLEDLDGLAAETAAGALSLRVLSAPVEQLFGPTVAADTAAIARVNDDLARVVAESDGRFAGLATVDAFAGAAAVEQIRHAVQDLGLAGIVVDSSRHGRHLAADLTLPTLETAAALGVPVFVHPVFAADSTEFIAAAGIAGNAFGRGVTNGLSLLAVLEHDVFEKYPGLALIFTTLGSGALMFAADRLAQGHPALEPTGESGLFFDTTRFNAPQLRYLGDTLGPHRLLAGSDWPLRRDANRGTVFRALEDAGFSRADQRAIAAANARRVLRLDT
ncbi:amidohydrolase family protein [Nocardia takedensis]